MTISDVTLTLFSLFNGLRIFSYLPQIYRVATDEGGAKAIAYSTWSIWIGANATTSAYALIHLGDLPLCMINASNTAGCLAVVILTAFKRSQSSTAQVLSDHAGARA
jgi:hypothetical protein